MAINIFCDNCKNDYQSKLSCTIKDEFLIIECLTCEGIIKLKHSQFKSKVKVNK